MDPFGLIYGLFDEFGELRYVGMTQKPLKLRLKNHLLPCSLKNDNYKDRWLRSVICRGGIPKIQTIQTIYCPATRRDLGAAEIYWISFFRKAGCRLTNGTAGGDGGVPDLGTRKKISHIKTGLTDQSEEEICQKYPQLNTHQLADIYGVHHNTIANALRRNGVRIRGNSESQGGLPVDLHQSVVNLYTSGESAVKIAERLKVSSTTIYEILKKVGVQRRTHSEATLQTNNSESQRVIYQSVVDMYASGKTVLEIAHSFNRSVTFVYKTLKRSGIKIEKSKLIGGISFDVYPSISGMYVSGRSATQIAECLNTSAPTIYRILKRIGVKLRTNSEAQLVKYKELAPEKT